MNAEPHDVAYQQDHLRAGELVHRYGEGVHILSDPYHMALVARLGAEATTQPRINDLVRVLYRDLIATVLAREFPVIDAAVETRMKSQTPAGVFRGRVIDPKTRAVSVDIVRGGMLPSQICFDTLNSVLEPAGVRQDHLVMSRIINDRDEVTGASIFSEKAGGEVGGRFLLFPDPMGATGSSLIEAIRFYQHETGGAAARIITLNLIVAAEFVRNLGAACPGVRVYAYRLDRGLSDPEVLASTPGTFPERERGLNEHQYIVPGAGGLGEVINNVYV